MAYPSVNDIEMIVNSLNRAEFLYCIIGHLLVVVYILIISYT